MAPDLRADRSQKKRVGNYRGRKPGSKNKRYRIWRDAEPRLMKKVLKLALTGDSLAIKIIGDRLWPRIRPQTESIHIREPAGDLAGLGQQIVTMIAAGRIAPDVGSDALRALVSQADLTAFTELEKIVEGLETKQRDELWDSGQRIGAQQKLPHRHRGKQQ